MGAVSKVSLRYRHFRNRGRSFRYKLKSFRDTIEVDSIQGNGSMSYLVDPMRIFSPRMWRENVSSREAAHAQTKYQCNSTSGRGARASYQTMLPEISARRSLLEPRFRYLSPGREGEKCRPLDHT